MRPLSPTLTFSPFPQCHCSDGLPCNADKYQCGYSALKLVVTIAAAALPGCEAGGVKERGRKGLKMSDDGEG